VDFDLDPTQRELRELAAGLLDRRATTERLEAHDRSGAPYDADLWKALGRAGLLSACLPEKVGGAGLGPIELAVILREIGAHVAPVPAYASLALAAVPLVLHGAPAQQEPLAGLAEGETVLTGAWREPGPVGGVGAVARRDGRGHLLDGVKTFVPYAEQADWILIPARVEDAGVGVFLVEREAVRLDPHPAATGEPMSRLALEGVPVAPDRLLGGRADGAAWRTLRRSAVAGAVAQVSGVVAGALKITTGHLGEREQFGRKLAQFQAVTMQIGDVYIAGRALDAALWAGVWRLAEQAADVDEVLAIAAFNACGPALEALYTCQHLHGGIGLDVAYPLHRYFAWGKHYAHLLGGAEAQLDAVADALAAVD